jgi:hypothetical protein
VLLDTIGIASICALLIVSSVPEILSDSRRLLPTLVGFAVLGLAFWKTRSIIIPTLSALAYGNGKSRRFYTSKVSILVNNSFDLFVTIVIISAVINEVMPKWIVRLRPLKQMLKFRASRHEDFPFRRFCSPACACTCRVSYWKTAIRC